MISVIGSAKSEAEKWLRLPSGLGMQKLWAPIWPSVGASILESVPKNWLKACILDTVGDANTI